MRRLDKKPDNRYAYWAKRRKMWETVKLWLLLVSLYTIGVRLHQFKNAYEDRMGVLTNLEELSVYQGETIDFMNRHCIGEYNKLFCKRHEHDESKNYKWNTKRMIATAICESGMNPDAWNWNTNGTIDVGLGQINSVHGYNIRELTDPEFNVETMYKLWQKFGEGIWYAQNTDCFVRELAKL